MRLKLEELLVTCHEYQEIVALADFTYFYGQMGAGKSSIARLADYCLGGELELTPALQSEFVSASLTLSVADTPLTLARERGANLILAQWSKQGDDYSAVVPARKAAGEVIPNTGVEVLSDLVFHLAGLEPPKVRRSKLKEDSDLERLSLRDLLWYCYLDQETIDSEFFQLDADAPFPKRNKSRDVLRFVVGFHQENVAALEAKLDRLRNERIRLQAGAEALQQALAESHYSSQIEIENRLKEIDELHDAKNAEISEIRADSTRLRCHGADELREQGRRLAAELERTEDAISSLRQVIAEDRRHLNEMRMLSTKVRRMTSARAVIGGVDFEKCPRCARELPARPPAHCPVCGQLDSVEDASVSDTALTMADIKTRLEELQDAVSQREAKLSMLGRRVSDLKQRKDAIDGELTSASREYDSAFLSRALVLEHAKARLEGEASQLENLLVLPQMVEKQLKIAGEIEGEEKALRLELRDARAAAEKDSGNLRKLEQYFLDCLVRARIPGFTQEDIVNIRAPWFLPEVSRPEGEGLICTSFANLGSGGKKTLFKCCFAIALHRLAESEGALLPSLLIVDSPMKNISERENREQFEGFYQLLYQLAAGELCGTQFILIDKEYQPPSKSSGVDVLSRHMKPGDKKDPPLLRGYDAH